MQQNLEIYFQDPPKSNI